MLCVCFVNTFYRDVDDQQDTVSPFKAPRPQPRPPGSGQNPRFGSPVGPNQQQPPLQQHSAGFQQASLGPPLGSQQIPTGPQVPQQYVAPQAIQQAPAAAPGQQIPTGPQVPQ